MTEPVITDTELQMMASTIEAHQEKTRTLWQKDILRAAKALLKLRVDYWFMKNDLTSTWQQLEHLQKMIKPPPQHGAPLSIEEMSLSLLSVAHSEVREIRELWATRLQFHIMALGDETAEAKRRAESAEERAESLHCQLLASQS